MLPGQKYTPEDILRIAWRRKWLIVVPLVAATVGAAIYTNRLPNQYRSETMILIVPQRVPESYVRSTVTARIEDRLLSIQQQILSRSRLERIIQDFGLYPNERKAMVMEDVVELMRLDILIKIERGDGFKVSYVSGNPRVAQKVTERLASLFIEENLRDREVLAEGTSQFLDAQLEDARRRLLEHEKKLEQYRRQYAGQLPQQVDSNVRAIQNAQLQVQSLSESMNRDRERRLMLERQLNDLQTTEALMMPPPSLDAGTDAQGSSPVQQLEAATARLKVMEFRYRPDHPDIVTAKRLIRDLEARLDLESSTQLAAPDVPSTRVNTMELLRQSRLRELQDEIAALDGHLVKKQADEGRLREVIPCYQARVDGAPTRESEVTELMRDYATLQTLYTSLLGKREDSKISANLERRQVGEQFKVLDPARVPERPFSPNRLRLNAMAAAAGLALGLALAALLEYRNASFKTEEEILQVLQVPVLALVPMMRSAREVHTRKRRRALVAAAGTLSAVGVIAAYVLWVFQA